jgi:Fur family ferric uptake transcriptional regulator
MLVKEALPGIDRVTLYRVLDWLANVGLAHKAADAKAVFRFSAADSNGQHEHHIHFRCTGCGSVFCLDTPSLPPPALPSGFRFSGMALDIRGECPRCVGSHS